MSSIQPTSPINATPRLTPATDSTFGKATANKAGFGQALKGIVDNAQKDQQATGKAIQDLLTGKIQDPLPVIQAAVKGDLSFKLLMGVRNKVIEAYKETMRMQV